MRKTSLFKRIKWAYNAFKVGPLPVITEKPKIITQISTPTRVVEACADVRFCDFSIVPNAKAQIAHRIADELLRGDCIVFTEDGVNMTLSGKVYVYAPEEDKP